jgi:hypothetical protein
LAKAPLLIGTLGSTSNFLTNTSAQLQYSIESVLIELVRFGRLIMEQKVILAR